MAYLRCMSENPPYPPNQPPPGYYPPGPQAPPTSSKATTSLVLGIISLVLCGLFLGIPAMIVARQAKREIAESQGRLGGEGLATAGFVTGLIGTIWSILAGILVIVVIAVGGVVAEEIGKNCRTVTDADGNTSITCD